MEHKTLVCPLCGAPHRKAIPAGTVQVQCSYCGSTIVVPSGAPRCPNHPDVLALNLCNDCNQSYCRDCLSGYLLRGQEESGFLNLCRQCVRRRHLRKAEHTIQAGLLVLAFGFLIFFLEPIIGLLWSILFAVPVMIYGYYKVTQYGNKDIIYTASERVLEKKPERSSRENFEDMLVEYARSYGFAHGSVLLANRLESYMKTGLSREEPIRKLAQEEGYT